MPFEFIYCYWIYLPTIRESYSANRDLCNLLGVCAESAFFLDNYIYIFIYAAKISNSKGIQSWYLKFSTHCVILHLQRIEFTISCVDFAQIVCNFYTIVWFLTKQFVNFNTKFYSKFRTIAIYPLFVCKILPQKMWSCKLSDIYHEYAFYRIYHRTYCRIFVLDLEIAPWIYILQLDILCQQLGDICQMEAQRKWEQGWGVCLFLEYIDILPSIREYMPVVFIYLYWKYSANN